MRYFTALLILYLKSLNVVKIDELKIYVIRRQTNNMFSLIFIFNFSLRVVDLDNLSTHCFLCEAGTVCPGGQTANYVLPTIIRSFSSSAEDEAVLRTFAINNHNQSELDSKQSIKVIYNRHQYDFTLAITRLCDSRSTIRKIRSRPHLLSAITRPAAGRQEAPVSAF